MSELKRLQKELTKAQQALERLTDLVRYKRHDFHNDGLISSEEYAQLVQHKGAAARLEGYDKIKAEHDTLIALLREAKLAIESEDGELNDRVYERITAALKEEK